MLEVPKESLQGNQASIIDVLKDSPIELQHPITDAAPPEELQESVSDTANNSLPGVNSYSTMTRVVDCSGRHLDLIESIDWRKDVNQIKEGFRKLAIEAIRNKANCITDTGKKSPWTLDDFPNWVSDPLLCKAKYTAILTISQPGVWS